MSKCEVYRTEINTASSSIDIELENIVKPHNAHFQDALVPLDPKKNPIAKYCIKRTSTMLGNLRSQKRLRISAIICEFVQDLQGSTYCTSVLGVAKPDAQPFFYDIKKLKMNDTPLVRISAPPKKSQSPTFRKRNALSSQEVSKQSSRVTVSSSNEIDAAEYEETSPVDLSELRAEARDDASPVDSDFRSLERRETARRGEIFGSHQDYGEPSTCSCTSVLIKEHQEEAEKAFFLEMAKQTRSKPEKSELALPNAQALDIRRVLTSSDLCCSVFQMR
eukprot:185154-Hanusia_phi.AAC.5